MTIEDHFRRSGQPPVSARAKKTVDIEQMLIWAYQDQCAGAGMGLTVYDEIETDEVRVGACSSPGGPIHPDAETLYRAVGRLDKRSRTLVSQNAKTGLRPNWGENACHRLEPRHGWRKNGRGERVPRSTVYSMDYRGGRQPAWIELIVHDSPVQLRQWRLWYNIWWQALKILTDVEFQDFRAVGPSAHPHPWNLNKNTS